MSAKLFLIAWRIIDRFPEALVRTIAMAVSDLAWLRRGKGVRQLEKNLRRVRPTVSQRHLRRLSRLGMRAYTRYYIDAFRLRSFTDAQISARCRIVNRELLDEVFAAGKSAVLGLGHIGNWDLAGRYAGL
ncbi:MAG TPA: phosphatidylinositol mannoside acyltransferase, partial [Actinomycetales bacterium]|nr:phosphatidylinositol mannoside acyltransferase [Actinomycetales bacterium]